MKHKMIISDFYCCECGNKGISLPRKEARKRENGHLKKIYCIYCHAETNHAEIKPTGHYTYEDFKEEYFLGRFVNGNRIEAKDLSNCGNLECVFNKDGKCWNANCSNVCGRRKTDE